MCTYTKRREYTHISKCMCVDAYNMSVPYGHIDISRNMYVQIYKLAQKMCDMYTYVYIFTDTYIVETQTDICLSTVDANQISRIHPLPMSIHLYVHVVVYVYDTYTYEGRYSCMSSVSRYTCVCMSLSTHMHTYVCTHKTHVRRFSFYLLSFSHPQSVSGVFLFFSQVTFHHSSLSLLSTLSIGALPPCILSF